MKNKRVDVRKSSSKKNVSNQQCAQTELERLIVDAGSSKKAADELLKWYTNPS